VVFESGANDLAFIVEILGADEADDAVYEKWIEASREAVGSRFERQLVYSLVCFCGERAALTGFEIHDVLALPGDLALAMMFENLLAAFTNHLKRNSEATICGLLPATDWKRRSTGAPRAKASNCVLMCADSRSELAHHKH